MGSEEDDMPQLSAETFAALHEFYTEEVSNHARGQTKYFLVLCTRFEFLNRLLIRKSQYLSKVLT